MFYYISIISDAIFSAFISFLLSFIILNYYVKRPQSIMLALVFSGLFMLLGFKISSQKKEKTMAKTKLSNQLDDFYNALCIRSPQQVNSIFLQFFKNTGYKVERKNGGIYIPDRKIFVLPIFNFEGLRKADVVKAYNLITNDQRAVIYTSNISSDVKDFVYRFHGKVNVFYGEEVYNLLKDNNSLPSLPDDILKEKTKKSIIKNILKKKTSKKYLFFGTAFLALSFFTPYNTYYTIIGIFFIVFSAISKFFGKD